MLPPPEAQPIALHVHLGRPSGTPPSQTENQAQLTPPTLEPTQAFVAPVEPPRRLAPPIADEPAAQQPDPQATSTTTLSKPTLDLRSRSVITAIAGFAEDELRSCDVLDKASRARRCAQETRAFAEPAPLIRLNPGTDNPTFAADMDRVAKLQEQIELLGQLAPQDAYGAALVRERQHSLRQEIKRIDKRHASFNLLKAVPIAKKMIQGLKEQRPSK